VRIPGTWSILTLIILIFISKYYFGYASSLMSGSGLLSCAVAASIVNTVTGGSATLLAVFMGVIILIGLLGFIFLMKDK